MEEYVFKSKARIAISPACNLKCVYCDNSRNDDSNRFVTMEDYRSTPISYGVISRDEYVTIMNALLRNGFDKVDFTGGEPMLNNDWAYLAKAAKQMGFKSVEMTTNGTLINRFLSRYGSFPQELDRLIVSLDTSDHFDYSTITGSKFSLNDVISGVKRLKKTNPHLKLTANCVLNKKTIDTIEGYIDFIETVGFDTITFLDLVVRDVSNKREVNYFLNEFLSGDAIKNYINQRYGDMPIYQDRHSYNVQLPSGLTIGLSDTKGLTRRDYYCSSCPCYCQEGLYTIRVATDGTISDCLGPHGIRFNAKSSIESHSLDNEIKKIYERLSSSRAGHYFDRFLSSLSGGQDG